MMGLRARWMLNTWAGAAAIGLLATGCKKDPPPPQPPAEEKFEFENPGGMWMPSQLADHKATLEKLGLAFPAEALTDPTAFPLGAVVSLGGCSASFVSPDGLLVTNHHCVTRALQHNSTPDENLLHDGYLAKDRGQELWAGPGQHVFVSTAFTDVTAQVLDGLDAIADDHARALELAKRARALTEACEAGKTGKSCTVASYFDGAQYIQIEQLHIQDVRLVYAPHAGIGVFGGEIDNWRWPRHTGDYSFLRAYVGPDGNPAPHAAGNVPYKPPHHLEVATEPLREGDFAMVAGYPGSTYRLKTAAEVREAVDWYYPQRITRYDQYIELYERLGQQNPELAIKAASRLRGLANYRTNFQGMLDGLTQGGLAEAKAKLEGQLQAWIDADEARKGKYGTVLAELAALQSKAQERRDYDGAIEEIIRGSTLLRVALAIRGIATQRTKPEAERKPGYTEAEITETVAALEGAMTSYDPVLDQAVLKLALQRAAALPEGQRPDVMLEAVLGRAATLPLDDAAIDKALGRLYGKTKLGDPAVRTDLLSAPLKKIERSRDPMLEAATTIELVVDDVERRQIEHAGAMASLRPIYVAALREFSPTPLAPDANGTLRVTYGTVRGYRPTPDAEPYVPFTTVSQMVAKATGEEPFAAPPGLLAAAQ
ncbi:MAG: S46 family peptidase, partial [Myxococcales bacterium]|nr:S46 family peptidase [Myxococcales bacterium]